MSNSPLGATHKNSAAVAPDSVNIALMVAMAENHCIGVNNALPWHLPEDLKHFKRTTLGKPVVMGRKTFESIGRPLPGRANIVISRNAQWQHEGVMVAKTLEEGLAQAVQQAAHSGVNEVVIIGGAQIYNEALGVVDRLYITRVHTEIAGDAFFPDMTWEEWQKEKSEHFCADDHNPYNYSFEVWARP